MLDEKNSLGFLGEGVTNAAVTWQEPWATAAPKGHLLQRIRWSYAVLQSHHQGQGTCLATKHLLARADPSAEWGKPLEKHLRSACWSPSELAGITSRGEGTSSRAGKPNRSPTSPPALFCLSCHRFMQALPHSCPKTVMPASGTVARSLSGCLRSFVQRSVGQVLTGRERCSHPAFLLREGNRCSKEHRKSRDQCWDVNTSLGCLGPCFTCGTPRASRACCQLLSLLSTSLGECRDRL